ncbi:odorant receptor 4-like [Pseudomyrmex gracilis]|uniref:odorant receptor 4-like n=1 Tax=Pseudomyrmex gracilis TaxID=219809 RepID=UPI000994960B|nr:odorant receptor 4-like [Pseudomyrmex gracilis]
MQSAVKHYYNINKFLVSKLGGWPSQSKFMRILAPTIITSFIFSIGFLEVSGTLEMYRKVFAITVGDFQFVKFSETWRTLTQDCECFIVILITIGGYIKLFALIFNKKNIERLLSLIDYHWTVFTHSTETPIMHEYAMIGRMMTISYSVLVYSLMSLYMLIPVTPQLLDLVKPLNKSRPYKYLFDIDYSFEREEYYYFVLLHAYITTVVTMSIMITVDALYMVFAEHACGLFAAIGSRLEALTPGRNSNVSRLVETTATYKLADYIEKDEKLYREIIVVLKQHQLTIEYVCLLDSSFSLTSFILLFINIIVISLLGIQILSLLDRKEEMTRYVAMSLGGFMHLFVLSYPGQRIIDHSSEVFHKAYNVLWYRMPRKSSRLINMLLHQCLTPCTLTAGKIYVLSMTNYASMVQASMSYFTALSSFS